MIAIDPGINGCGVARFAGGYLIRAWYEENPTKKDAPIIDRCIGVARSVQNRVVALGLGAFREVVCEWPQVYRAGLSKGDPGDLLPLVAIGVSLCTLFPLCKSYAYLPHAWKGSIPKGEVYENRLFSRLSEEEKSKIISARSKTHNILDAIGIGLHHLGRFEPKRVISRG